MTNPVHENETWSTGQAAKFLGFGVRPRTIGRWIESGHLAGVQLPNGHRRALISSVRAMRAELEAQAGGHEPANPRKVRVRRAGISPMEAAEILRMAPVKVRRLVDNYIAWCEERGFDPAGDNSPAVPDDDKFLKGWKIEKESAQRTERRVDAADVTRRLKAAEPASVPRQMRGRVSEHSRQG